MTNSRQSGLGIAVIIVAIVVLAILGYAGYRVYTANTSKPASTNNTATNNQTANNSNNQTQSSDPYTGWKMYCDTIKKTCFKYPADWTISSHDDNGVNSAVVKSPNNNLEVDYSGCFATDGSDVSYYIASIDDLTQSNTSWKVVGRLRNC